MDLTLYAPPVGDQGMVGSCVSWALAHTMLGWYANAAGEPQTLAPMYVYSQTHASDASDGGGSSAYDAYNVLSSQGVDTSSDYTQGDYDFTDMPTAAEIANAAPYKTTPFHALFASTDPETGVGSGAETVIKQALASGHPVGLGIPIYDEFYNLNATNYTVDLNDAGATSNYQGGHYIVALGYDSQGVTIENSWGTTWGNHGFAKLDWNFIDAKAVEAEYIDGFAGPIPVTSQVTPTPTATATATPTPTPTPVPVTPVYVPSPATHVQVSASTTSLKTHWGRPSASGNTPISGYRVKVTGPGFNRTYKENSSRTSLTVTGLKPTTTYTVTITVLNRAGLSSKSTVKHIKTAAANPRIGHLRNTRWSSGVSFSWTGAKANSGHITKYVIATRLGNGPSKVRTYWAGARRATITGLRRHRTYKFTYTVYNSAGRHSTHVLVVTTR